MAAAMGGNVRVGLEDSLWIGKGRVATSIAQQVLKVREILHLKGKTRSRSDVVAPDQCRPCGQARRGASFRRRLLGVPQMRRRLAPILSVIATSQGAWCRRAMPMRCQVRDFPLPAH